MSIGERKIGLVTLGCAKNEVDSEYMLAELESAGFGLTGELSRADAIVVNTCGFIEPAKEESIETILEAARYKQQGVCRVLGVVGCLAQRYSGELAREMPEVDFFLGVGEPRGELVRRLAGLLGVEPLPPEHRPDCLRVVDTVSRGWAYLKISEGCNNRCAYCAIPLIRGSLVSRPESDIVREAAFLEEAGARELDLIAQDVTAYGADRGERDALARLLESILEQTGIPWIRLLYTHPAHLDQGLLELMASESRLLSYLDIPVQHASDHILAAMGRGTGGRAEILEKIALAREILDEPVLRTTVMVGFPGERTADFEQLLDFVGTVRFDRLGAFAYSAEEDTPAAGLRDSVPRREKERRLEQVMELQRGISADKAALMVGRRIPVLVEGPLDESEAPEPGYTHRARGAAHAPEVDGCVYLRVADGRQPPESGTLAEALIEDSGDYDLFGSVPG